MNQRDIFFNEIIECGGDNIVIITTDFGCAAFDKIKNTNKLINIGAQEQLAITISVGLALQNKKTYVYGICPFITLRALEQIRVSICSQNLPATIVGVGAGLSYDIAGLTHQGTEDLNIMRCLPNMTIANVSSVEMAKYYAEESLKFDTPLYVRLDKKPSNYDWKYNIKNGWFVRRFSYNKTTIISTGEICNYVQSCFPSDYGLIEVYQFPCNEKTLKEHYKYNCGRIITIEEGYKIGGLSSYISELGINIDKKIGFSGFCEAKSRRKYWDLLLEELGEINE